MERFVPAGTPEAMTRSRRALIWDARNSASLLIARSLRAEGWTVDWLGMRDAIAAESLLIDGERYFVAPGDDSALRIVLEEHPLDAFFVHGDDSMRWLLARHAQLPWHVRRHLSDPESLRIALSKEQSLEFVRRLGIPIPRTRRARDAKEIEREAADLGGDVVLKSDGGSAGSTVRLLREGERADPALVEKLTAGGTRPVLVQRRLTGPKLLVTVVYERGVERASCAHEKIAAWPASFGVTAFGVTRRVPEAHDYAHRIFQLLAWHGPANVEFRQDARDGRWYFMEINPRVPSSIGLPGEAGVNIGSAWANVCAGRGSDVRPIRTWREGVAYAWSVPALAFVLRHPRDGASMLRRWWHGGARSDFGALAGPSRWKALRLALWHARQR